MKTSDAKKGSAGKRLAVGAGLAAIAAAGVGAYLLSYSKNAAKNRKKAKSWTLRAQKEVIAQIGNLKEVNEGTYKKIVKEVSERYKKLKTIDAADVSAFAEELRGHWQSFAKEMQKAPKAAAGAKRPAKKSRGKN
jgi:hypothetical protein